MNQHYKTSPTTSQEILGASYRRTKDLEEPKESTSMHGSIHRLYILSTPEFTELHDQENYTTGNFSITL